MHSYPTVMERGITAHAARYLPPKVGKVFVISTEDTWQRAGGNLALALEGIQHEVLLINDDQKRLSTIEGLADRMVALGAERSSVVIAFGDAMIIGVAGFLAAIFMRGIPVVQIPTVRMDPSAETGVDLASGKNLIGSFHPPIAVLVDPDLPDMKGTEEWATTTR
jgi:3-dehydroquinate synthase